MRFDPSMMTAQQMAEMQAGGYGVPSAVVTKKPKKDPYAGTALEGTAGIKGQQLSGISDLGYEPEFVPPQELNYISDLGYEPEPPNFTGALGINPDTGETFLPDSQPPIGDPSTDIIPPGFLDGLIPNDTGFFGGQGPGQPPTFRPPPSSSPFGNSIRPQQQFNPYGGGFGGGFPPRNPYGTGGIGGFFSQFGQQPSYGGGFGGQRFQPPMMPQQQFNSYGGGFGGQRFQPPMMPQQQFNPYGGGFGGQRFQPPMMPQQQFNSYGGGGFNQAPNPFGGSFNSPLRQFMNPQILPFNMQPMTGTTPPQQGILQGPSGGGAGRMAAPGFNTATGTFGGGQEVSGIADAGEPIMSTGGSGSGMNVAPQAPASMF